jgi:hypothetical protein
VGFVKVLLGQSWSELVRFGWAGEVLQVALRFGGLWSGKVRQARYGY